MKQKKFLALGMATVMAFSSTMMVLADDATDAENATGTVTVSGGLEGYASTDKFVVTLPTTDEIKLKLDPQELLLATQSSAKVDENAMATGYGKKVLFASGDDYVTTSPDIAVVNKSTYAVDVSVNATLSGLKDTSKGYDIKVKDSSVEDFDFGTDTAIAMTLTPSTATSTNGKLSSKTAVSADVKQLTDATAGVTVTETLEPISTLSDAYAFSKGDSGYSYALKSDVSAVAFNAVSFNLSGSVNISTKADWTKFNENSGAITLKLTYSVKKHTDAYTSTTALSSTNRKIEFTNLPADETVTSMVVVSNFAPTGVAWTAGNQYTVTGSGTSLVYTVNAAPITNNVGGTLTITYKSGHTDIISIN